MKTRIEQLLKDKLSASIVEVTDDSDLHKGHAEAQKSGGGHFAVLVVSEQFEGKGFAERHRMVYNALHDLQQDIHALAIKTYTTKEFMGI